MKEKISSGKRRKYDASFREEVVKMVLSGRPVTEVAQSLGMVRISFTAGKAVITPTTWPLV